MDKRLGAYRIEFILIVSSLVVHLLVSIFLFSRFGDDVLVFENEDARGYIALAESLVAGEGFARDGMASAVRTPVYPLFLAVFKALHLPFTWSVLIAQNILATLAVVMLYRMGSLLFSRRAGLIAAWLYMLEPYMLMTANLATTETLFNFLVIAFLYTFSSYFVLGRGLRWLAGAGILIGLGILTRPVLLYAPLLLVALLALRRFIVREPLIHYGKAAVIFLGCCLLVLLPWSIRQYVQFGTPRITNIDAQMLYYRVAPLVVAHEENISYIEAIRVLTERLASRDPNFTPLDVTNNFRHYAYMTEAAGALVARHPGLVVRYYAASLIPTLTGTGYEYMLEELGGLRRVTERVSYTELIVGGELAEYREAFARLDIFQIVLLVGAGLWAVSYLLILCSLASRASWREHGFTLLLLLAGVAYFVLFALGPASHARYRMPTFPFLFLLLAYALDFLAKKRILRPKRCRELPAD